MKLGKLRQKAKKATAKITKPEPVLFPDHPFEPSIQLQEDGRWCVTQGLRNGGTMGSYLNTLDGAAKHAMWLATDPFDQLVDSKKVKR